MERINVRLAFLVPLVAAGLLAGCSGDDGAAGPPGAAGAAGATGPAGPPGPSGITSGIPVSSAGKINVAVNNVTIPAGGGAPVVNMTLTNDLGQGLKGLPAANIRFVLAQLSPGTGGASSAWQSYVSRSSNGVPNAQATTETATAGTYTDNGDGTYQYTFANALTAYAGAPTYDASKTHRLGVEIRTNSGGFLPNNIPANNAPYDFVPGGGAPTFKRLIVDNDTCNACHDNLEFHGEARFDVEYCVQCHNPSSRDEDSGNSVDMKIMVHKIHYGENLANGYTIFGFRGTEHDYSHVKFPQDVRNCQTCHEESDTDTPQASNWRMVANRDTCGSCHDNIDFASATAGHPGGLVFTDDTQCLDCHGPTATVNGGAVQTAKAHEIPTAIAGQKFKFNVVSVANTMPGDTPSVTISVTDPTNGDAPYDLHADAPFTTCARGASRLAVGLAWSTTDFANTGTGSSPGLPVSMNPLAACGGASVNNGDGTFTVTSPVAIPAGIKGSLAATLEGHPAVVIDGSTERIAVTNAVAYAPITDAAAVARRDVVNIEKCDECHNQLSLHGNNRTDKPEVCATCHNPNATDINRRAGDCLTAFGADDVSIDFKYMVHAIHASGAIGAPYDVCGFGNRAVKIDFHYPGKLQNCEGCHNAGTYYPVDPSKVLGTTVDANDRTITTDDVVVSPNSSVCSACHNSDLAKQHMKQNGGDFTATKAADGTLISAGVETCQLCHGEGRSSDVKEVHGVGKFLFN
ncbi:MAG: OmcA/MtrC family decaheme c-type cytochrome [Gammaproteobacteria bacterium]|nr:OmcA/MtrC family decaheme c-type cytochrome [Gammaproteobacteria bacterium]